MLPVLSCRQKQPVVNFEDFRDGEIGFLDAVNVAGGLAFENVTGCSYLAIAGRNRLHLLEKHIALSGYSFMFSLL